MTSKSCIKLTPILSKFTIDLQESLQAWTAFTETAALQNRKDDVIANINTTR